MSGNKVLRRLFASCHTVLLDFDGPITRLLPPPRNAEVADAARSALGELVSDVPADILSTTDHLAVLRFASRCDAKVLAAVEASCSKLEDAAASVSMPTNGAHEFIQVAALNRKVVVVTNNTNTAVETYAKRFGLQGILSGVFGRPPTSPEHMKPSLHLIRSAVDSVHVPRGKALMIGDSITDIEPCKILSIPCIGFGLTQQRRKALRRAGADAVTDSMEALTQILLTL